MVIPQKVVASTSWCVEGDFPVFWEINRKVNAYIMALTIKEEISDDSAVSSEGEKGILKVKKRKNKKKR